LRALRVLLLAALSATGQTASGQNPAACDPAFAWGVNGHPTQQAVYSGAETLRSQLNYLLALGATHYRVDLTVDTLGSVASFPSGLSLSFDRVLQAASDRGITLLPVLTRRPDYRVSPETNFRTGYLIGRRFAERYGWQLCQIEAGNETEEGALRYSAATDPLTGRSDTNYWAGTQLDHYDPERLNTVLHFLGGLTRGLREGAPQVQIVIDVAGRHYGFFEALERAGVDFDIYGLHWYSDMDDAGGGFAAALEELERPPRRPLPIWVTEVNRRGGSQAERPGDDQGAWIRRLAAHAAENSRVKGFFVYELLDQPAHQSWYGLVSCPTGGFESLCLGGRRRKPAFETYREAIRQHQRGWARTRRQQPAVGVAPVNYPGSVLRRARIDDRICADCRVE